MRFFALLACLCTALLLLPTSASATTDVVQSWSQNFQVTGGESADVFTTDSKGNVYIGSYVPFLVGDGAVWLIRKLNSLGELQWSQSFYASDTPADIVADAKGNVYITSTEASGTQNSVLTVQLLSNGDVGWVNEYAGGSGEALHLDSAGNLYAGCASSTGLLLLEYNSGGLVINTAQRTDITPTSMFFMPNGCLVASGLSPGTTSSYMEVISSAGTYLYSSITNNTATDTYGYIVTCDPANNIYLVVNNNNSSSNTNTFTIDCYGPNGAFNWQTPVTAGQVRQASASDTNHAYVQVFDSGFSNMGFGANGSTFMNATNVEPGLIAADGSKGLVTVSNSAAAFTYSEMNAALQILWTETYTVPAVAPQVLKVINSTVYSLNQANSDGSYSTNFIKYVQGVGITAITAAAPSIQGGKSVNITIQLNDPAAAPGLSAYFVSSSSALGLPNAVLIPTGKSSVTVTALTDPVDVSTTVTITGEVNGGARSSTIVLEPAVLSTLTFPGGSSASVVGGKTITGTITLTGKTALLAHTITLSSNSAKTTVPATVSVLPGASTATFVVSTTAVTANTPVVITAKAGGITVTAKLTVAP